MTRAVDIEGRGVRVNGRSVGVGSAIPDSVIERSADDTTATISDPSGIVIAPKTEFGAFRAEISQNTSGLTKAYLWDLSDNTKIDTVDISNLDVFEVAADFVTSKEFALTCDAEGSNYTFGFKSNSSGNSYASADFDVPRTASGSIQTGTSRGYGNINPVGGL